MCALSNLAQPAKLEAFWDEYNRTFPGLAPLKPAWAQGHAPLAAGSIHDSPGRRTPVRNYDLDGSCGECLAARSAWQLYWH
jgi:hypothetical protein